MFQLLHRNVAKLQFHWKCISTRCRFLPEKAANLINQSTNLLCVSIIPQKCYKVTSALEVHHCKMMLTGFLPEKPCSQPNQSINQSINLLCVSVITQKRCKVMFALEVHHYKTKLAGFLPEKKANLINQSVTQPIFCVFQLLHRSAAQWFWWFTGCIGCASVQDKADRLTVRADSVWPSEHSDNVRH